VFWCSGQAHTRPVVIPTSSTATKTKEHAAPLSGTPRLIAWCSRIPHLLCNPIKLDVEMNYMQSGLMGLNLTPCERRFAAAARQLASGRQVLYHGTRYLHRILSDGVLQFARIGLKAVSLSRLPEWPSLLPYFHATTRTRLRLF
jgi:hypothetical protein